MISTIAVLGFFIRPNTGIISFLIFLGTIALVFFYAKQWKQVLLMIAFYIIGILLFAFLLPIDFLAYIKLGWRITSDYNDAMFLELRNNIELMIAMAVVLITLVSIAFFYRFEKKNPWTTLGYLLMPCGIVYVLFKQGYTRADAHQVIFLSLAPAIAAIFFVTGKKQVAKLQFLLLLIMSTLSVYAIQYYRPAFAVAGIAIHGKRQDTICREMLLPASIKEKIGKGSIDFIPGEISIPWFNDLNYSGRPVPQSYQAYNSILDSLNAQFIHSGKAPEWLVINNGSIDQRHPGWDENRTKLAIISQYVFDESFNLVFDTTHQYLLLQQRQQPVDWKNTWTKKIQLQVGDTLKIPRYSGIQWMEAHLSYQFSNKVRRFLFHPRFASISMGYNDGSTSIHTFIKPIMESGVILSPRLLSDKDVLDFYSGHQSEWRYPVWMTVQGNSNWIKPSVEIELSGLQHQTEQMP